MQVTCGALKQNHKKKKNRKGRLCHSAKKDGQEEYCGRVRGESTGQRGKNLLEKHRDVKERRATNWLLCQRKKKK